MWNYFDISTQKSLCQVVIPGESPGSSRTNVCGHAISGKFATSMKSHLKKAHPKVFEEVLLKEEALAKLKKTKKHIIVKVR